MSNQFDSLHLACEADRVDAHDRLLSLPGYVSGDERVLHRPHTDYTVPSFIRTTAPDLCNELQEILTALWEHNEAHVGELVKEVEACSALSGSVDCLSGQINAWSELYFARRAEKTNPRDADDPSRQFFRLVDELYSIFARQQVHNSTDYIFVSTSVPYVQWLIYRLTLQNRIFIHEDQDGKRVGCGFSWAVGRAAIQNILGYLDAIGVFDHRFEKSLCKVLRAAGSAWVQRASQQSDADICRRIGELMGDIQQMRPFLIKNFRAEKTIVDVSDDLLLGWDWCLAFGVAHVFLATTRAEMLTALASRKVKYLLVPKEFAEMPKNPVFLGGYCYFATFRRICKP
jgi:hypothetical protein